MGVAVGRLHLKHAVAKLEDRDIKRAAAEVEHGYLLILVGLVESISQSGCGRLVDNTLHGQSGNLAGLLGGLTLRVVEVGRHSDDGLRHSLSEIVLGGLLHLLKYHGRDLLRSVLAAVDVDTRSVVGAAHHLVGHALYLACHLLAVLAHETLDRIDRALGVGDGLTLGRIAHLALSAINKRYYRRSRIASLAVGDHHRILAFENGHTRVGGAEVNAYNLSHN